VQKHIRHAVDATLAAGKVCGILAPAEDDARRYMSWGCQFVAVGIDISLLRQAAKENLARYREDPETTGPSRTY
jgi:4-hydroxy-2-oxoheptanedioate aldolase